MLGGELIADSIKDLGSCFTLTISAGEVDVNDLVYKVTPQRVQQEIITVIEPKKMSGTVLLAEDNSDNQQLITLYIRRLGAKTVIAQNGQEAFELAKNNAYDLVLMDMQMPIMGGIDATVLLRKQGYKGYIIALTANASKEDQENCYKAGCDAFLTKPIDQSSFNDVVSNYLRARKVEKDNLLLKSQSMSVRSE
jgi:CheY-like chemotaxis protein